MPPTSKIAVPVEVFKHLTQNASALAKQHKGTNGFGYHVEAIMANGFKSPLGAVTVARHPASCDSQEQNIAKAEEGLSSRYPRQGAMILIHSRVLINRGL